MSPLISGWERVARAVEKVGERLQRAVAALEQAGIPYAVVGGNAVAEWVGRVDEAAIRNTQHVDILVRRSDLDAVKTALQQAGFIFRHGSGIDMFLDGPAGKARNAVHLVFANEKVRLGYVLPAPDVSESEPGKTFRTLSLEPLARMKLTSFRDKDRMHIRDMLDVGLLDATWPARFPPELAERLREILASPEG